MWLLLGEISVLHQQFLNYSEQSEDNPTPKQVDNF